jgi:hypothetical protein
MWGECANCGHGPHRSTHRWDANRYQYTYCTQCTDCDRPERLHGPGTHRFNRCSCNEFREAA